MVLRRWERVNETSLALITGSIATMKGVPDIVICARQANHSELWCSLKIQLTARHEKFDCTFVRQCFNQGLIDFTDNLLNLFHLWFMYDDKGHKITQPGRCIRAQTRKTDNSKIRSIKRTQISNKCY